MMLDQPPVPRFVPYVTSLCLLCFAAYRSDWPVAAAVLATSTVMALIGASWRRRLLREQARASEQQRLAALRAEQLTHEVATLSAVLEGMAEGVWLTDAEGRIVRHNQALKELLYAGQDLNGQRPLEVVRRAELHEAVTKACQERVPSQLELTLEGLRPRILSVRVTPLGKDVPGSAAVFHDLTDLRRLESVRRDFVANVSHELRTPLTAIRGYAETLSDGVEDAAQAQKMVHIIRRQSERLSALVEDLLEISRLESNELRLLSEPVPVSDALRRVTEAVRPKAEAKRIHLALALPDGMEIQGDEQALEQVLLNLLDNAVKYTPEGGRVELAGRALGETCEITVKDNGVGIEAKHLPRLFERFYRVDKGRSRDMGGTGLGLSIVKHVVQAMKGEVRVLSEPGQGSTFTVVLPSARDFGQTG